MIASLFHHVWAGSNPFIYPEWRLSWMKHHPDASFRFWRDAPNDPRMRALLEDTRYTPTVKSDILRWAVLFQEGGVYVDTDMECLAPLGDFLDDPRGCFVAAQDSEYACSAIIAAEPYHPFVGHFVSCALEALAGVSPETANTSPQDVTGPILLTRLLREHPHEVTVHPYHRFYPIHYGARASAPLAGAVTNHHWVGEWKKRGPGWRETVGQR